MGAKMNRQDNISQPHILCVDDKKENIISLEAILDGFELPLLTATSAEEGLRHLLDHNVGLILLDVQMPEIDGFEFATMIKDNPKTSDIPIIFITAINKDIVHVLKGYSIGAVDYLTKPIEPSLLRIKVNVFKEIIQKNVLLNQEVKEKEKAKNKMEQYYKKLQQMNNEIIFRLSHNEITNLLNVSGLQQYLEDRWDQSEKPISIISLEFKSFDNYVTTFGQKTANEILISIKHRLEEIGTQDGMLVHVNTNHFAVLLFSTDTKYVVGLAHELQDLMNLPLLVNGEIIYLCARVGVAEHKQQNKGCCDEIIKTINMARDKAKHAPGWFATCNDGEQDRFIDVSMISKIKYGLLNKEFELYFQPKVDLSNNSYIGAEALIRWNDPKEGLIQPSKFIGFAEKMGIISNITHYIIYELAELSLSINSSLDLPIHISFNVSTHELYDTKLIEYLTTLKNNVQDKNITFEVEITENVLINDFSRVVEALTEINKCGFKISIDDFGTGFSSLSYVSSLPIDNLKIDKCFVMNLETDAKSLAIVQSIAQMVKELNIGLVAEGIETKEQSDILRQLNCNIHQGYYYSKPVPLKEFISYYQEIVKH